MFCRKDQKKTFSYIILYVWMFNWSYMHIAKFLLTFLLCVPVKTWKPTRYRQERQLSVDQEHISFLQMVQPPRKEEPGWMQNWNYWIHSWSKMKAPRFHISDFRRHQERYISEDWTPKMSIDHSSNNQQQTKEPSTNLPWSVELIHIVKKWNCEGFTYKKAQWSQKSR